MITFLSWFVSLFFYQITDYRTAIVKTRFQCLIESRSNISRNVFPTGFLNQRSVSKTLMYSSKYRMCCLYNLNFVKVMFMCVSLSASVHCCNSVFLYIVSTVIVFKNINDVCPVFWLTQHRT